jgi:hypothetical protein
LDDRSLPTFCLLSATGAPKNFFDLLTAAGLSGEPLFYPSWSSTVMFLLTDNAQSMALRVLDGQLELLADLI